jgi:hypothetical protein
MIMENGNDEHSAAPPCYAVVLHNGRLVTLHNQRWADWWSAAFFGEDEVKAGRATGFRVLELEA